MSIKRLLFILKGIFLVMLPLLITPQSVQAEKTIVDDLYVVNPKAGPIYALDISGGATAQKGSLIVHKLHGLGNQLLSYQYRPEKEGYIISLGNTPENVLESTPEDTVKSFQFKTPVNNLTEFDDRFIWDIKPVAGGYHKISNRKSGLYFTINQPNPAAPITLTSEVDQDSQKFKFQTMNGVYYIRNFGNPNYAWAINAQGITAPEEIEASLITSGSLDDKKWLVFFKPNDNAYVISTAKNKKIIVNQTARPFYPTTILNNFSYEQKYSKQNLFTFSKHSDSGESQVVKITNAGQPGKYYSTFSASRQIYSESFDENDNRQNWLFEKIESVTVPTIENLNVSGASNPENSLYYIGKDLTVTGDFTGKGYNVFDLYSRFDTNNPVLNKKDIKVNGDGTAKFSVAIDTKDYKEGDYFIEFFVRADGMIQSNRLAFQYKLVYPTPTADTIPKTVRRGTPLSNFKATDFVKNMRDEIGSEIEVLPTIENLDLETVGEQTALISLKNAYKTEKIKVPVTVLPDKSDVMVQFQKKDQGKTEIYPPIKVVGIRNSTLKIVDNPEIQAAIQTIENKIDGKQDYLIVNKSEVETIEVKDVDTQEVTVKFDGYLRIEGVPEALNFMDGFIGRDRGQEIPVQTGKDILLSIHDSRSEGHGDFTVKAKLESDLHSVSNSEITIKEGTIKLSQSRIISSKNFSPIITSQSSNDGTQMKFDYILSPHVSQKPNDKMKLMIPRWSVKEAGEYTGTIVWNLENGP